MARLALAAGMLAALIGCMLAPMAGGQVAGHVMMVSTGTLAFAVLIAFTREARRHTLLVKGIARLSRPGSIAGQSVALVPGLGTAFVGGLRAPRIFWGDELAGRLDDAELHAVLVHERHHQLARAPLRIVAVSTLEPWLRHLETGRAWIERERARVEIAADAFALAAGATRPVLASALLKLSSGAQLGALPGFATAADLRIRALIGESTGLEPDRRASWGLAFAGVALALACVFLALR